MQFGIFPKEGGQFAGILDEARLAESVGFDSCWVCEHHVDDKNYWPAPLIRLAGIAAVTDDLDLVTAVVLPPLHNAVELAEQCAMLDQLSNGRLTIGVGLGYVQEEFEAYGIPMEERSGRLVESLGLLDRYLSAHEPVSFDGNFWSLDEYDPNPQSVQEPRPSLWVGGWGELAIRRAVGLGDAWLPGGTADFDGLARRQETEKRLLADSRESWDERPHPLMREVIVAKERSTAESMAETYLARTYREEYGSDEWSHPLISEANPADFWELADERFLIGTPNELIEQIEQLRSRITVDHIGCRFHHPGMSHELVERQIELFGEEVLPAIA